MTLQIERPTASPIVPADSLAASARTTSAAARKGSYVTLPTRSHSEMVEGSYVTLASAA